jgi:glycosyltransferase involved in cell wall biosynthesis
MKNIIELYNQVQEEEFEKAYPLYHQENSKIKILYVAPFLNGTGYYRMLLPLLELNKTMTHSAIVTNIRKWNFAQGFDDSNTPIDPDLIAWADYIVLPAMFSDIRKINETSGKNLIQEIKKHNEDVLLVMDLDSNFHVLPKEHPSYEKLNRASHTLGNLATRKKTLLSNIAAMDLVTGATEQLLNYYESKINKHFPNSKVTLEYLPNLISHFSYQNIKGIKRNQNDKLKIGLIGNYSTYYDILSIKEVLTEIYAKYKDKIEIILFGWNGKVSGGEQPLKEIEFTHVDSVNFVDYYKDDVFMKGYFSTLNDLKLDIALLPMLDIPFNKAGKSPIKYLELSAFKIPVVASNILPYREVIDYGENGLLAATKEEWVSKVASLIENKEQRIAIGEAAFKHAYRTYCYTTRNLETLQDTFI